MSLMMNLIIDQGNSSAKIALFQGDEMLYFHKYEKFSKKEAEEVQKLYPYTQAIISSVTEKDEALTDFLQKNTKKFIVLSHQTPIPLKNLYKTPETLGRDRIAVCVGANHLKPNTNILVIDAGTAITYDIVNAQNEYVGGNISLGIAMRSQALHTFTAKLPLVDVKEPNVFRNLFPYDEIPKIAFNDRIAIVHRPNFCCLPPTCNIFNRRKFQMF